jgi:hypothetical protein
MMTVGILSEVRPAEAAKAVFVPRFVTPVEKPQEKPRPAQDDKGPRPYALGPYGLRGYVGQDRIKLVIG